MIGGSGEKRTLRLVAQYADMCNVSGGPATVRHKLDVMRAHCADVGRDPAEITTTRLGTLVLTEDADETARVRDFLSALAGDQFDEQFTVGEPDDGLAQRRGAARSRDRHPDLQHAAVRRGHRRPGRRAAHQELRVACIAVSLAERLGYAPDAKLLIVNCDDLGSSRSANVAVYEALRDGVATSSTLMVPCPWARDAAAMYRGEDVGVHLTLNSEWDTYRWGPITHSPSLLDGDGGFPRTVADVWDHADLDEVRKECRAQLDRAIYWGFDVSHLDSHMGTMQLRPEFFDVYLELAVDFRLPLRMAGRERGTTGGVSVSPARSRGRRRVPRSLRAHKCRLAARDREGAVRAAAGRDRGLSAPGASTPTNCAASHPDWANRVEDHAILTERPAFRDLIDRVRRHAHRIPRVPRAAARVSIDVPTRSPTCAKPRCRTSD